ncbi:Firmicu-CTERM sorting domain-containing protein [Levilactobacillus tongjiangensis]|uniref:Firmicu-CTERM sorting domain-containing protein n=1 Tax=Levilactobacillus tongjiangensis TaxID=2486023 RepID=A0ABW1SP55_9LACO|nr:Firmicu-CTERM sorting domain-containing protein [Levilactobacillus tongjiangensis]
MRKAILFVTALLTGVLLWGASTTVASANTNNATSDNLGITIDGNFDDWQDKPMTTIKEPWDDYNIKKGSMLADANNLYLYINMSPKKGNGYNEMQGYGYVLTAGSKTYDLQFNNVTGTATDKSKTGSVNIWNRTDGVNDPTTGAQVMVHRFKTGQNFNDVMEAKVPIADLKLAGGSQTFKMTNSNLGSQTLTVTGGSTGPVVLAGVGFAIALGGVVKLNKSRKKRTA